MSSTNSEVIGEAEDAAAHCIEEGGLFRHDDLEAKEVEAFCRRDPVAAKAHFDKMKESINALYHELYSFTGQDGIPME